MHLQALLRFSLLVASALILILIPSGCIFVPLIDSVRSAGVTEGDRQRLLLEEVRNFNNARYWGKLERALSYVAPEGQNEVRAQLRKGSKDEKLVESKVDDLTFSENARLAEVAVITKFYKVPYYLVTDRRELQNWSFSLTEGWKVTGLKEIKE